MTEALPGALPADEKARLEHLYALDILDTAEEERFDRLTRLAAEIFRVPIALVSLVDRDRQWFKSYLGMIERETPREISFCSHALSEPRMMLVEDLTSDPRFRDNPLVQGPPYARFYAGAVLRELNGNALGTLCLLDHKPRRFDSRERSLLLQLSALVEREINAGVQLDEWRHAMAREALFDPATGLPNQRLFTERAQGSLDKAEEGAIVVLGLDEYPSAVLELDMADRAQLDAELARRAQQIFRGALHLAALGQGRFAALMPVDRSPRSLVTGSRALQAAFAAPLPIGRRRLRPTIGICLSPWGGTSIDQLLTKAELARPKEIAHPDQALGVYSSRVEQRLQRSFLLSTRLREALKESALRLVYQPKVNMETGRIAGFEALLRWFDTELGEVSPAEFIPVAERSELILDLSDWVLREACRQYMVWQDSNLAELPVAVNLTAQDLQRHDFMSWLEAILGSTGMPADKLVLEITERSLVEDVERAAQHMAQARGLGVAFHVDDFGTGYSSLSQLHRLPLTALKVDRSFVSELERNNGGSTITRSIISLACNLGLEVIAEGIETDQQRRQLQVLGCQVGQGYLFSRPLEAADLPRFQDRFACSA